MANKLDMSLDEIIRSERTRAPRQNGFSMNRRNDFKRRPFGKPFGQSARGFNRPFRDFRHSNRSASNGAPRNRSSKLHVSNLASTVTTEDVEELFSTFGSVLRSFVHYDQDGNSLHTAEVVFEQRDDAFEARNKLNNVPLDGKPLHIVVINENFHSDPFTARLHSNSSFQHTNRRNFSNNRNWNSFKDSGSQPNRRRNNNSRPVPSAEDLDRELDEYRRQGGEGDEGLEEGMDE